MRHIGVAAAAALLFSGAPAKAALLIDTGVGAFLPNTPLGQPTGPQQAGFVVGPLLRTHAQFVLPVAVGVDFYRITGLQYYGTVETAGTISFSLATNAANNNEPGLFLTNQQSIAAVQGPGWIGAVGAEIIDLLPGTYWVGFGNDGGTLVARHFGNAPTPLGQESYYAPLPFPLNSYIDNDAANLSWRIHGEALANPVAPIPEPATWALMILGFGAAGTSIRCRSRRFSRA